jgi:hypothetical protein
MARLASRLEDAVRAERSTSERLIALRYLLARVRIDEDTIVRRARKEGLTWNELAHLLHMTESGCRRRYVARGIS